MTLNTQRIIVIDRETRMPFEEQVWGEGFIRFLYGDSWVSKIFGRMLLHSFVRWPIVSWMIGKFYDTRRSSRKINPFCEQFGINVTESVLSPGEFTSFNDFFTRRLREECRPQVPDPNVVTIPADGRYSFFEHIGASSVFSVKDEPFSLEKLLGCGVLASRFYEGTAVICRLCPSDCHRFYFPTQGKAGSSSWIHGSLFSVNPVAIKGRPWIWWKNRRTLTFIETKNAGVMAYIEVGATNCGSIVQTFVPNSWIRKGEEKGYFRLGGSAIILLFEPGRIALSPDLLKLSETGCEVYCKIGQPLARVYTHST